MWHNRALFQDPYDLALLAHLMKHPEDRDARFRVPRVPLDVFRDAARAAALRPAVRLVAALSKGVADA